MIIAVGFKVNNERAVQFRKWANTIVKDFTIKGWVMDDERLKNGGSQLTKEYFDKLIEKVREIRLSERRFYQKVTDIYATAVDYDPSAKATKRFQRSWPDCCRSRLQQGRFQKGTYGSHELGWLSKWKNP